MNQLMGFFEKYKDYKNMSGRCALDGRYFWKVLQPYPGLIRSEMYFRINLVGGKDLRVSPPAWDYREYFNNRSRARYRLVKIIIDISRDPTNNHGSVHSNLLYFDLKRKEIVRFEPMMENGFTEAINRVLEPYLEGMFPEFKFRMRSDHPQMPITEKCPRKGFCAAYTLKSAMLLVNGLEKIRMNRDPNVEEESIMIFASAIEEEFGVYSNWEEEDSQYGKGNYDNLNLDVILGEEVLGIAYKKFIDVEKPNYSEVVPNKSPGLLMYSAPYYGYSYGPRYAGTPGWGWGRPGWAVHGFEGEHGCGCGVRRKVTFNP